MHRLWTEPILDARVRAAWQSQLTAAIKTPGLLRELVRHRGELLPCFAAQYQQLRALPKRVRRVLQRRWATSLAGVALMCVLGVGPAHAAIINVTTNVPDINADGQCALIKAIVNANDDAATHADCIAGSGADTINLQAGSTHTLTASNNSTYGPTGLPLISSTIIIEGNDSTIQRDGNALDFRIFAVSSGGDLTLQETTVSGGNAIGSHAFGSGGGGGVFNFSSTVTLTNSTITGNSARDGGGVFNNTGVLILTNSTVTGNSAFNAGGGVINGGSTATVTNSTISGNSAVAGGGVYNIFYSTVTVSNSRISGNSAYEGGGVFNGNRSTAIVTNTRSRAIPLVATAAV